MKTYLVAFVSAAALAFATCAFGQGAGAPAPGFALPTLDGDVVDLEDFRGAPLLLNFWATWCPPCREELPLFQQASEAAPGLQVFLINAGEERDRAARYFEANGLVLTTAVNPDGELPPGTEDTLSVARRYRVRGMPTTFFIDSAGVVRSVYVGEITPAVLSDRLAEIGVAWTP